MLINQNRVLIAILGAVCFSVGITAWAVNRAIKGTDYSPANNIITDLNKAKEYTEANAAIQIAARKPKPVLVTTIPNTNISIDRPKITIEIADPRKQVVNQKSWSGKEISRMLEGVEISKVLDTEIEIIDRTSSRSYRLKIGDSIPSRKGIIFRKIDNRVREVTFESVGKALIAYY
jgi:hypothetical protein